MQKYSTLIVESSAMNIQDQEINIAKGDATYIGVKKKKVTTDYSFYHNNHKVL